VFLTILLENCSINYTFFFRKVKYRAIEIHKLLLVKLLCGNIRFKASRETVTVLTCNGLESA